MDSESFNYGCLKEKVRVSVVTAMMLTVYVLSSTHMHYSTANTLQSNNVRDGRRSVIRWWSAMLRE